MKKLFTFFISAAFLLATLTLPAFAAPEVSAKSCILIDAESGASLFEYNADAQMPIASTTKILTALVVIERCKLEDTVFIESKHVDVEGSSMYLVPGETLTVRELLYGLLLASGNDAATALAYHTAGDIDAFADLMNEKAASLGCSSSNFTNPHGLNSDRHYSTAGDLAIIAATVMENDTLSDIVSTKSVTISSRSYTNHNKLLWTCDGALGMKTGYTSMAGRTLVSCAERDGIRLICVTLNDPDDWDDHINLYDWGFSQRTRYKIEKRSDIYAPVPVISGVKDYAKIMQERE